MIEKILCQAMEQKRSLLCVNEHFAIRRLMQNYQSELPALKIVNDETIFVRC